MTAVRKNSSLSPKKKQQSQQVQMRAVFAALILKFQSLISTERKPIFCLADCLEMHLDVEQDQGKFSREGETASFLLTL